MKQFVSYNHSIIYAGREKNDRSLVLLLDQEFKKYLLEYYQLSERILTVKLEGKPFKILIIIVYAPTTQNKEE